MQPQPLATPATPVPVTLRTCLLALSCRPLVPLAVALIAGVVSRDAWPVATSACLGLCALCLTAALVTLRPSLAAGALLGAALTLGASLHSLRVTPARNDISSLAGTTNARVIARAVHIHSASSQRGSCVATVIHADLADGRACRVSGQALVRVNGDAQHLTSGATLSLAGVSIERPPTARNWFQTDRRRQLSRQGIHAVLRAEGVRIVGPPSAVPALVEGIAGLRDRMFQILRRGMGGKSAQRDAQLLAGMVFGETAIGLDENLRELFRKTGTIHLLVVSGAQVAIILAFIFTLHRPRELPAALLGQHGRGRPTRWHLWLAAPILVAFGLMVGMGPSVVRSLAMAGIWLAVLRSGRRYDLPSSIALAAIILVVSDTSVVFSVGAQLTFAATIGVALCVPAGLRQIAGLTRWQVFSRQMLQAAAFGTLGAWLMVTPLLAHHFHNFALLGSIANIVAVPLSGAIVILGLIGGLLGAFWWGLAVPFCALARVLIWIVVGVNNLCARLPLAMVDDVSLSAGACLIWFGVVAAGAWLVRSGWLAHLWRSRRAALVVNGAALLMVVALLWSARELWPRPCRVVAFDVGEGQCTLIETPERRTIMVDAGSRRELSNYEVARDVLYPYLVRRGHRELDVLIVSHPDIDHYGAARYLCRMLTIRLVLVGPRPGGRTYRATLQALHDTKAKVMIASSASRLRLGATTLSVLAPAAPPTPGQASTDNNASVVVRLDCKGLSALLPGDLEVPGMKDLLLTSSADALRADYLQLPHHGRDSANLPAFFRAVQPRVAVVTRAGEDDIRGGIQSCREVCANLFDTQVSGAVAVEARREGLRVSAYLGRP